MSYDVISGLLRKFVYNNYHQLRHRVTTLKPAAIQRIIDINVQFIYALSRIFERLPKNVVGEHSVDSDRENIQLIVTRRTFSR